jgi:hypothetical protein
MRARHPDTSVLAVAFDGAPLAFPRVVRVVFADEAVVKAVQAARRGRHALRISHTEH